MQSTHREPPNKSIHPPRPLPLRMSFSSLPEDIVLSCLARIPKAHHPKLSLVSNSFRWLVLSDELDLTRSQLKTREECVYLGLHSPTNPHPMWFSLWIKPDHQTLNQCTVQEKSTGNLLVRVPSSYSRDLPNRIQQIVGSEVYVLSRHRPSSTVLVYNNLTRKMVGEAPSMMVARQNAQTCVLDGKIYVMGGCRPDESTSYFEVFDLNTKIWESLPDPGPEVRFCSNKILAAMDGKILVKTKKTFVRSQKIKKKIFVYLLQEKRWIKDECSYGSYCEINNVKYSCMDKKCLLFETKSGNWELVNGLTHLDAYSMNDIEIVTNGGNLVMFWDSIPELSPLDQTKKIWCAVIKLTRSHDGEVWGQIEWLDVVLTIPMPYTLFHCGRLTI